MGRVLGALVVLASVVVAVAWWTGMPLRLPALHPDDGVAAPQAHGHYQCAMHPQIVSDRPGSCPICGMKLVFVADDAAVSGGAVPVQGPVTESPPAAPGSVPGRMPITIDSERQQLIGVRTAVVGLRRIEREIRATGRVAYDPKSYQALTEYREAMRSQRELAGSSSPEARAGADGLARAARLKLRQQGVSEEQAREILRGGTSAESLLLPGRTAWIYAQLQDRDAAVVRPGQRMSIRTPALPGRAIETRVASVDPIVDPSTRTVRVRAQVSTLAGELRPESLVDATIFVASSEVLAVPDEAIVDTGREQFVFVVHDGHRFEPRSIVLGRDGEGFREVLSGLQPGDRVVVSANFLVDSESRFRAAAGDFRAPADPSASGAAAVRTR
jgi:membrane fusion protein, copper/silver efflux system